MMCRQFLGMQRSSLVIWLSWPEIRSAWSFGLKTTPWFTGPQLIIWKFFPSDLVLYFLFPFHLLLQRICKFFTLEKYVGWVERILCLDATLHTSPFQFYFITLNNIIPFYTWVYTVWVGELWWEHQQHKIAVDTFLWRATSSLSENIPRKWKVSKPNFHHKIVRERERKRWAKCRRANFLSEEWSLKDLL